MEAIFINLIYYMLIMVITIVILSVIQKGFFWKFLKVKSSMGKLVLVKIREVNRDDYRVGSIEEGDLIYKLDKDNEKRLNVPEDVPVFYKSIGVTMIDVDSKKNAICKVNYEGVQGFDAVKQNDLLKRALYKPKIDDQNQKIILIILAVLVIAVVFLVVMNMQNAELLTTIQQQLSTMKGSVSGTARV